ncbi:MAG: L-threonine dehydrogenase [Giesbergeria sp.]
MTTTFFMPAVNLMGAGCLQEAIVAVRGHGFRKALIMTDKVLAKLGVAESIQVMLAQQHIESVVFDGVQPNPTVGNVRAGLAQLTAQGCDFIVSLGGGSAHDCAKGVALCATNGGEIADYEGVDRSAKPQLPLVSINTTAGTASEMTRFCIITDEVRHIKMAIVDRNVTPLMSVNDPELMLAKPKGLTAATGMDALTHAIEAYVSTAATPITDACALKAVELIAAHLRTAVADGSNLEAREQMAYAQFLAGMAFNNASLGYVHAMAHQLGGFYDLPHGVCNALLLPHVEAFNVPTSAVRLAKVAEAMGVNVQRLKAEDGANACLAAIRKLGRDIGIPASLAELGVKDEDIALLATNALADACGLTNPRKASKADIEAIFRGAMVA